MNYVCWVVKHPPLVQQLLDQQYTMYQNRGETFNRVESHRRIATRLNSGPHVIVCYVNDMFQFLDSSSAYLYADNTAIVVSDIGRTLTGAKCECQ